MILWKERILAALVPITTVIVGSLSSFLGFFAPLVCYFILKSFRQTFAATNAMRYFDICITAMAYAAGLIVFQFALGVVSKDSGGSIPLISDGIIPNLLNIGVWLYLLLAVLLHVLYPLLGKEFKMPFSVRLFEALVKYRSNKSSNMDGESAASS